MRAMSADVDGGASDDAVLPATRALGAVIAPVLVVAWIVLYPDPTATGRWFAWEINPTMTPMVLGSAYLGGAYFFVRVLRARAWHAVHAGFVPVTLFASSLGIATILHWDKFNHDHLAFWLWAGLYFTTPFAVATVWWRNRARDPGRQEGDAMLAPAVRWALAVVGLGALLTGLFMFLLPSQAIDVWPWQLSPLTARVMAAVLMLGVAGIVLAADGRSSAARIMVQVAAIMVALMLLAAVRARSEFFTDRPLTWLLAAGMAAVLVGAVALAGALAVSRRL